MTRVWVTGGAEWDGACPTSFLTYAHLHATSFLMGCTFAVPIKFDVDVHAGGLMAPSGLKLHPIPDAALDADIAILGKKGRGKTFTAKGIVERLLEMQRRVLVLDPLSTW